MDDQQTISIQSDDNELRGGPHPASRQRVAIIAIAVLIVFVAGVGAGLFAARSNDESAVPTEASTVHTETTTVPVTTEVPTTRSVSAALPRPAGAPPLAPRWLPEGLTLRSVRSGDTQGGSCQPGGGLSPSSTTSGVMVGPGVCAVPSLTLDYSSALVGGPPAQSVTFVLAGVADLRTASGTTAQTVHGKPALLYRTPNAIGAAAPSELLWLAWTEDSDTTLFLTTRGLTLDDTLRVADSVTAISADELAKLRSSVANPTGSAPMPNPLNGVEVGRLSTTAGDVRLVETADRRYICLVPPNIMCQPLPAPSVGNAQFTGGGTSPVGALYWLTVPEALPNFTVRDQTGATLPSLRTVDQRRVAVVDPTPTIQTTPTGPSRTFQLVDADGNVLAHVTAPYITTGPIGTSSGPPGRAQLIACLRDQGLDVSDQPTGPATVNPTKQHPPNAAQAAWQTCRHIYITTSGMPIDQAPRIMTYPDCMASQGWLITVMSGPPADTAAYNIAQQRCQQQ